MSRTADTPDTPVYNAIPTKVQTMPAEALLMLCGGLDPWIDILINMVDDASVAFGFATIDLTVCLTTSAMTHFGISTTQPVSRAASAGATDPRCWSSTWPKPGPTRVSALARISA